MLPCIYVEYIVYGEHLRKTKGKQQQVGKVARRQEKNKVHKFVQIQEGAQPLTSAASHRLSLEYMNM